MNLCRMMDVKCVEKVSHTLWDPEQVIATNGGIPPLTYQMFLVSLALYLVSAIHYHGIERAAKKVKITASSQNLIPHHHAKIKSARRCKCETSFWRLASRENKIMRECVYVNVQLVKIRKNLFRFEFGKRKFPVIGSLFGFLKFRYERSERSLFESFDRMKL